MSRALTTDDIKKISELVVANTALKEWALAMDDGLGINPPWQVSIETLAKLLVPFNGATNNLDLGTHDVYAANIANMNNTSDLDKPVSTAQRFAINQVIEGVLWQPSVVAIVDTPPVATVAESRYMVGTAPTGVFVGHADDIATYNAGWTFETPQDTWALFVYDTTILHIFITDAWIILGDLGRITEVLVATEAARDAVLNDAGFIAVSADLIGPNTIGAVAGNEVDVSAVGTDLLLGVASKIKIVADDKANIDIVALDKVNIDAVALSKTNIDLVAVTKVNIDILAPIKADITTVAGKAVQVTALGARTVEIDALYAQLPAIAEKESIVNVDALKGVGWTTESVKGNAIDIATKTSKSEIAYDVDTSAFIANTLASGAIIERGSNANGSYIKFADGTLICSGVTGILTIPYVVGSLYYQDAYYTFSHTFYSSPITILNAIGSGNYVWASTDNYSSINTLSGRAYAANIGATCVVSFIAIGRWK